MNRKINEQIETVFLMPNEAYTYLSSRLVKEVALLGASVDCLVPPLAAKLLKERASQLVLTTPEAGNAVTESAPHGAS